MEMKKLESSNLAEAGWTRDTGLVVKFKNGKRYIYPQVPREIYVDLLKSNSKGRFFNENIVKTQTPFAQLEEGDDLVDKARQVRERSVEA